MPQITAQNVVTEIQKCNFCKSCEETCAIFLQLGKAGPYEKLAAVKDIISKKEKPSNWEAVFLCTKCEACDNTCPLEIPITKIIDFGRETCVKKWGIQYPRQETIIENILKFGNPFGKQESRTYWLKDKINAKSKTLLHLGCMISYPLSSMGQSMVKILKKLEVDFTISPNERCCGYFIFNTGNHETAGEIIAQNLKEFNKYERIITACAGCYTFLKEHYPLKNQLKHVIEVIFDEIKEKELNIKLQKKSAIFQDSCHIARPHGIVEIPRKILRKMGVELLEFNKALCCGADGGMRIINPSIALELGKRRLLEAREKSNVLFTLCPFCIHNFREAAQTFNIDISIKSIFEILEHLIP